MRFIVYLYGVKMFERGMFVLNKGYDKKIKIRDAIYGFIELDDQEREIINSPYFQRLRRIKQLSLTDMVYPGACHTRFEHSLGVMQMATDMYDNLVKTKGNLDKLSMSQSSCERTRKILRMAALLHDIGHPPFAHAGEEKMPVAPEGHPVYMDENNDPIKFEHEHYGHAAIKMLFEDIIEGHILGSGLSIMVDEVLFLLGDKSIKKTYPNLVIFKELISGQVDADRADYLLRDSLHLGVNYGIYDRNRLVSCITVGKDIETEAMVMAIEEGGWQSAESLVLARYQMFSQVYFHKVRRIFDYHVGKALGEILKHMGFANGTFPPPTSKENMEAYLGIDDWAIQGMIMNGNGGEHGTRIVNRTPYKKMQPDHERDITSEVEERINTFEAEHQGRCFVDRSFSTKWYKLDSDIKINNKAVGDAYPLSTKSKIVANIGQPKVTRFYADRMGGQ